MSKLIPGRGSDQFVVRFPDGMRDRIAEAAKAAGRSMNAEIVARLDASFSPAVPGEADLAAYTAIMEFVFEDMKRRYHLIPKDAKPGGSLLTGDLKKPEGGE